MWLNDFRDRFERALHEFLWRQWTRLGVPGAVAAEERWLLDPEALLLFTIETARSEPRLFDEVLDWLLVNGSLVDVQRLRNVCDLDTAYPRRLLEAVAAWVQTEDPSAKWQRLATRGLVGTDTAGAASGTGVVRDRPAGATPDTGAEPLLLPLRGGPPPLGDARDPIFASRGFARSPFRPRRHAVTPAVTHPTCLRVRLRELLGLGIRAEVLAGLAIRRTATAATIADFTCYSAAAVQQVLREMAASGLLGVQSRGRERLYTLDPARWGELFRPGRTGPRAPADDSASGHTGEPQVLDEAAGRVDWVRFFRALSSILRLLRRADLAARPDSQVNSEFRLVLQQVSEELQEARLPFAAPALAGESLERQIHLLLQALEELLHWMRIELPAEPMPVAGGLDARARRIADRLTRLISPAAATFYRESFRVLAIEPPLAAAAHLVANLATEIHSSLRKVILGAHPLPAALAKRAKRAEETEKAEVEHVLDRLRVPREAAGAQAWLRTVGKHHGLRHRDSLLPPHAANAELAPYWEDSQSGWDAVLEAFESQFLSVFPRVQALASLATPGEKDATALLNAVSRHPLAVREFFRQAVSPTWLTLLNGKRYFEHLLAEEPRGWVDREVWIYLKRMAASAPADVTTALHQLRALADPVAIQGFADVVRALPAQAIGDLAGVVAEMVARCDESYIRPEVAELVPLLVSAGSTDGAFKLATALVQIEVGKAMDPVDEAAYPELLRTVAPALAGVDPQQTLDFLSHCLEKALRGTSTQEPDSAADSSPIFYETLATAPEWAHPQVAVCLVTCLRDTCLSILTRTPAVLKQIVQHLEGRNRWVFRRLALFLLARFARHAEALAASRLLNAELMRAWWATPEYLGLEAVAFGLLSQDQLATWWRLIEKGPALDSKIAGSKRQAMIGRWRADRLSPVAHLVPEPLKAQHPDWFVGLPPAPAAASGPDVTSFRVREDSPKSAADLLALGIEGIADFLERWTPDNEESWRGQWGLCDALFRAVETEPVQFSKGAMRFRNAPLAYRASFLGGLQQGVRAKQLLDWESVLALCATWRAAPPGPAPRAESPALSATDLSPTTALARALAEFLAEGLVDRVSQVPIRFRSTVWDLLLPLTRDADPAPADELLPPHDRPAAAELSLHCTRGIALHAVIRYALWVRRAIKDGPAGAERLAHGFGEMPEVSAVLEDHLDSAIEPGLAPRAVYGQWFPWLVQLDPGWSAAHAPRIFPAEPDRAPFDEAAWEAYVALCDPYDHLLPLLTDAYRRAIRRLGHREAGRRFTGGMDPERRLAEHLMVFCGRGRLDLDDREGLLYEFFAGAPAGIRTRAIEFVGRSLRGGGTRVPGEVLERFRRLWEQRMGGLPQGTAAPCAGEVQAFRWWFVSGAFDERWALDRLADSLRRVRGSLSVDRQVVERLAPPCTAWPTQVISCMELLVGGEGGADRHIRSWSETGAGILATLEGGGDPEVRRRAAALRSRLVARGFERYLATAVGAAR